MEDVLSQSVHRVPVYNNTEKMYLLLETIVIIPSTSNRYSILSQSDIIHFLYEHIRDVGIARYDTVGTNQDPLIISFNYNLITFS